MKQVFQLSDSSKIAGSIIESGKVTSKCFVKAYRNDEMIFDGTLLSLRREKDQVKEVVSGTECGIGLKDFNDLKEKDVLKFFTREKKMKKNLSLELIKEERKNARIKKISELVKRAIADTFQSVRFYRSKLQQPSLFSF